MIGEVELEEHLALTEGARGAFIGWIEAQEPTATVGWAGDTDTCPIARWLEEKLQAEVQVSDLRWSFRRWNETGWTGDWALPAWATEFVRQIDQRPTLESDEPEEYEGPVMREDALDVLVPGWDRE